MKVGFIGLGIMGRPMAKNMLKAGVELVVADLNKALGVIEGMDHPDVEISYFVPDVKKQGGHYAVVKGTVKRIDSAEGVLLLINGTRIPLERLLDIEIC